MAPSARDDRHRTRAVPPDQPGAVRGRVLRPRARARRGRLPPAPRARQVRRDLRAVHRRVLHDPRRRAAGAGGVRDRRSLGGRHGSGRGAPRHPRARDRALGAAGEALEARAATGTRDSRARARNRGRMLGQRADEARQVLRARDLSDPDAARRRAGAAVSVRLRPLDVARCDRRRPRHRRGAVRAGEGARGAASDSSRSARSWCRSRP